MQSTPSLTAFVAGATGYTGREVVRVLADRGARVVAHVRPDSTSLESRRRRFTEIGAEVDETPWDEAAMTATLERLAPGVIFGLLGTTRARAARAARAGGDPAAESYERVDYGLTMQLVRSAVAARAPARFVYLSSLGVPDRPSGNAYLDVRRRVEAAIRASGLRFTLARPSFITGEDRDEARTADVVEVQLYFDAKVVAANAAYLWLAAVA